MDSKFEIDYDDNTLEVRIQVDVKSDEWEWYYDDTGGEFVIVLTKAPDYLIGH